MLKNISILFVAICHCFLTGCSPAPTTAPSSIPTPTNAPALVPISQDPVAARHLFDSWKISLPPKRLVGNIHYVGFSGVSSFLITTPDGHILIDTCFEESAPHIQLHIEALGFKPTDIKFLLSSHAHADHVGGHAAFKRLSGARIVASAEDARLLASGGADDFSPFPKELMRYEAVTADRIVADGDEVTLGGVTLTARLTPGHTKGATTWTMRVTEGEQSYNVVFFSSVSLVTPTRLLNNPDYPTIADDYAATFEKLKSLPCDIFFAPHAEQFGLTNKLSRLREGVAPNPFIDPAGWQRVITAAENIYQTQLAAERAAGL